MRIPFIILFIFTLASCGETSPPSDKDDKADKASIVGTWKAITHPEFPQSGTFDANGNGTMDVSYTLNLYWVIDLTFIDVYHSIENPLLLNAEITQDKADLYKDLDFIGMKIVTVSEDDLTITYTDTSVISYTVNNTTLVINPGLPSECMFTRVEMLP